MKFVLLHEVKNDEGIRAFFVDVWELYVKVCTFYTSSAPFLGRCICLSAGPVEMRTQVYVRRVSPCTAAIRQLALQEDGQF